MDYNKEKLEKGVHLVMHERLLILLVFSIIRVCILPIRN
jgi:hypothetical protein